MFAFGVYVGGGLSSLSIALAKVVGWRGSAYTVAGYGLLLSLLVRFTVREPVRTPAVTAPAPAPSHEAGGGGSDSSARSDGLADKGERGYSAKERFVKRVSSCVCPAGVAPSSQWQVCEGCFLYSCPVGVDPS